MIRLCWLSFNIQFTMLHLKLWENNPQGPPAQCHYSSCLSQTAPQSAVVWYNVYAAHYHPTPTWEELDKLFAKLYNGYFCKALYIFFIEIFNSFFRATWNSITNLITFHPKYSKYFNMRPYKGIFS